jgi:hypothetical protein
MLCCKDCAATANGWRFLARAEECAALGVEVGIESGEPLRTIARFEVLCKAQRGQSKPSVFKFNDARPECYNVTPGGAIGDVPT